MLRKNIERIKLEFPYLYEYLQNEQPDLISEPTDDKINIYNVYIAFYFGTQAGTYPENWEKYCGLFKELTIQE